MLIVDECHGGRDQRHHRTHYPKLSVETELDQYGINGAKLDLFHLDNS